jgi:hypothetical protein
MERVEPLLRNDREISKYTRAISRQRLCKHVPAATDTNATMVQQQRNGVFCVVHAEMLYNWDGLGQLVSFKSAQLKVRL